MNLAEAIRLAWTSLRTSKMRSFLTLLGVIIGIASVIAILTLGAGVQKQTMSQLEGLGAKDIQVRLVARKIADEVDINSAASYEAAENFDDASKINPDIIERMREYFGDRIAGISIGDYSYDAGEMTPVDAAGVAIGKTAQASMKSVNADFFALTSEKLGAGRLLNEEDIEGMRPVAVISNKLLQDAFGGEMSKALGSTIEFAGKESAEFEVVGVLAKPEGGILGTYEIENFYVPYTTGLAIMGQPDVFNSVTVRGAADVDQKVFATQLQNFLDQTWAEDPDVTAKASDFSSQVGSFMKIIRTISQVISLIAGISLLVGGIGIMNIMLVTVTERTREIGVRKALGATRGAIRTQFVVEAMIICLFGGVLGVLLGGAIGMAGGAAMGAVAFPPLWGVIGALVFSIGIGLFFGYYPANKAAKLDPIEALRYE